MINNPKIADALKISSKCWYTATCLHLANNPENCPHHPSGGKENPETPYSECVYFAQQLKNDVVKEAVKSY